MHVHTIHNNTKQYTTKHNTKNNTHRTYNTQQYTTIHNHTQQNTTIHNNTQQYTPIHTITQQYTTIHNKPQQYTTVKHKILGFLRRCSTVTLYFSLCRGQVWSKLTWHHDLMMTEEKKFPVWAQEVLDVLLHSLQLGLEREIIRVNDRARSSLQEVYDRKLMTEKNCLIL